MDSVQPTIYATALIDKGYERDDKAKYRFALQDADHVELPGQAEGRMEPEPEPEPLPEPEPEP